VIRQIARLRRIVLTGSAFLLFFTGGVLLSYLVLPAVRVRSRDRADAAQRCRALLARAWVLFHRYMHSCGLLRFNPRAVRLDLPPGPFVLVANHPTLVDVTALISVCPNAVSVAKPLMFRSPLVGRLLRYCGHIEAGNGAAFVGSAIVAKAVERLAAGTPVLIFPEGTRSPEGGLGEFRPGAFAIAALASVPVVPVFITCDPPTLMRGQRWYEVPSRTATLTVTQLPTLWPPHGSPAATARSLRAAYLRRLGSRPAAPEADDVRPADVADFDHRLRLPWKRSSRKSSSSSSTP
jgi:1-acyl-sn-glycerol-3-phosphate acyltransferase